MKLFSLVCLLELCPLAQRDAQRDVPGHSFKRHARAQFQRVSWLPYCMKVKNVFCKNIENGNLTHNVRNLTKCGVRTRDLCSLTLTSNHKS